MNREWSTKVSRHQKARFSQEGLLLTVTSWNNTKSSHKMEIVIGQPWGLLLGKTENSTCRAWSDLISQIINLLPMRHILLFHFVFISWIITLCNFSTQFSSGEDLFGVCSYTLPWFGSNAWAPHWVFPFPWHIISKYLPALLNVKLVIKQPNVKCLSAWLNYCKLGQHLFWKSLVFNRARKGSVEHSFPYFLFQACDVRLSDWPKGYTTCCKMTDFI